jgi:DNA-binding MarR family transcriptional regulator
MNIFDKPSLVKILIYLNNKDSSISRIHKNLGLAIITIYKNIKLMKENNIIIIEKNMKNKKFNIISLTNKGKIISNKLIEINNEK